MKELLLTRDSLANRISYYHLLLLLASLPFDRFYSHLILISFAIHTLIQFNKERAKSVFNWRIFLLQSVFIVTVISTLYSINKPGAYNEWGKQVTILLVPLLFCFTGLDIKKYRARLLLAFSLVCTATVIYLYLDAANTIRFYKMPFSSLFSPAFTNHNFAQPIDMHATFLSMQLAVAMVYLISLLFGENSIYYKVFYAFCICVLTTGLFQLCSKSVIFCLFIVVNIAVPWFLLNRRQRWKFMAIAAAITLMFFAGIFKVSSFRARYITALRTDLSKPSAGEETDPRTARWDAASGLIAGSPVLGYGAGTEIGLLHQVYFTKKYYSSFTRNLNVHNQYLSFLLKSGIFGLLIYMATLTFGFREAFLKKDLLFFTFMMLVAFVSFSENFLDVDKGIFFYALFFSFFIFSGEKRSVGTVPPA